MPATVRPSRLAAAMTGLLALALFGGSVFGQSEVSRADRIRAALVFKITKFVSWPDLGPSAAEPLRFCSVGPSPVAEALASGVIGRSVGDRPAVFEMIPPDSPGALLRCHVVYFSGQLGGSVDDILRSLRKHPILTVSDRADFARGGGAIALVRGNNRITFEINLASARAGGLQVGAPLLELATLVETTDESR